MKTKIYLLTGLALSIQVICNSQSNSIHSDLQNRSNNSSTSQTKNATVHSIDLSEGQKKILPTLEAKESSGKKSEIIVVKSANIQDLLLRSDNLLSQALKLRTEAKTQTKTQSTNTLKKARDFETEALVLQLQACEIRALHNFQVYYHNKLNIKLLVSNFTGEKNTLLFTYELIIESEQEMKFAKELREEAEAQPNLASKIGSLGNAEEKEFLALHKQNIALNALAKNTSIATAGR